MNDAQLAVGADHAVLQVVARGATQRLRRGLAPDRPILGVYPLPHFGKSDRAFTRRQPKDAVGFVGQGDAICVEVTFPVADMRDALSFFELGLAPTQTIQRLLETRSHESERLREQADFIVSPNLGQVSPFPLCDRLRRPRQGSQRPQRASDHPQSKDHEDSDEDCADDNREIRRTIHRPQEIRGWHRGDDAPLNFAWCFKAINSRIDPAALGVIEGKHPPPS